MDELNKNLDLVYEKCKSISEKYNNGYRINEEEYAWFIFSANIYFKSKDLILLNRELELTENEFDSSLHLLSRSILEDFIFFKYIFSEKEKISYRIHAFICFSLEKNQLKLLSSLGDLGKIGKFIFDRNSQNILSSTEMIDHKKNDINASIKFFKEKYGNKYDFKKEISDFENIKKIAEKYDKIKGVNVVVEGEEVNSMEWMYGYLYRFQCGPSHQDLASKERVFSLFGTKKKPNNMYILSLLDHIVEEIFNTSMLYGF